MQVHIFDFTGDLYGQTIDVIPRTKLRDEHKFDSFEALKNQIQADAIQARHYFKKTDLLLKNEFDTK